jgi:hypothetical protein
MSQSVGDEEIKSMKVYMNRYHNIQSSCLMEIIHIHQPVNGPNPETSESQDNPTNPG